MTTYWIRPQAAPGTYGLENGSSYANAFNGLKAAGIPWAVGGHEFIISGAHLPKQTGTWLGQPFWMWAGSTTYPASGTAEAPTIVRGNPDDPAIIWGGYVDDRSGQWTAEANNVWSYIIPSSPNLSGEVVWLFADPQPNGARFRMRKVADRAACEAVLGSFTSEAYNGNAAWTVGSKWLVRMPDSGNPAGRVVFPAYGHNWELGNKQHVIFADITFLPCGWKMFGTGGGPDMASKHVEFHRCRVFYGPYWNAIFQSFGYSDNIKIIDCNIGFGRQGGIYPFLRRVDGLFRWTDNEIPNNWSIRGCRIHDIGTLETGPGDGDAHAIGHSNVVNWKIDDCELWRSLIQVSYTAGDGITPGNNSVEWRRTIVKQITPQRIVYGNGPSGISYQQDNANTNGSVQFTVRQCIVRMPNAFGGGGYCYAAGVSAVNGQAQMIDSIADGGKVGIRAVRNLAGLENNLTLTGTIVRNPADRFLQMGSSNGNQIKAVPRYNGDKNTFIGSPILSDFQFAGTAQTLIQWQANGPTFDPTSLFFSP